MQPGLTKLLFNINFVEGRPSLVSDLNIVPAMLAWLELSNDVGPTSSLMLWQIANRVASPPPTVRECEAGGLQYLKLIK